MKSMFHIVPISFVLLCGGNLYIFSNAGLYQTAVLCQILDMQYLTNEIKSLRYFSFFYSLIELEYFEVMGYLLQVFGLNIYKIRYPALVRLNTRDTDKFRAFEY